MKRSLSDRGEIAPRNATPSKGVTTAETEHHDPRIEIGGSRIKIFNHAIFRETAACIWMLGPEQKKEDRFDLAYAALTAFNPQDEIEGMIAAQAVALHFGAMEALRRSMISEQPADIAARFRKDGANLARAMTDMLDALDRKRGRVQQVVRVERVVVNEGGQAIVGAVSTASSTMQGGGSGRKPEG